MQCPFHPHKRRKNIQGHCCQFSLISSLESFLFCFYPWTKKNDIYLKHCVRISFVVWFEGFKKKKKISSFCCVCYVLVYYIRSGQFLEIIYHTYVSMSHPKSYKLLLFFSYGTEYQETNIVFQIKYQKLQHQKHKILYLCKNFINGLLLLFIFSPSNCLVTRLLMMNHTCWRNWFLIIFLSLNALLNNSAHIFLNKFISCCTLWLFGLYNIGLLVYINSVKEII